MAEIDLTLLDANTGDPSQEAFTQWLTAALSAAEQNAADALEVTIQIVDEARSAELNQQFRGKSGATNVLSFPFSAMTPEPLPILGDLAICAPLVEREAAAQGKSLTSHWAHLTIHGLLHLCGYDHIEDEQAERMEGLEREAMAQLGFNDPYTEHVK